jgi:hypothetical protein
MRTGNKLGLAALNRHGQALRLTLLARCEHAMAVSLRGLAHGWKRWMRSSPRRPELSPFLPGSGLVLYTLT